MKTFNPELSFVMESRDGAFYETSIPPVAGIVIASKCVDCHMLVQASNALVLDAEDKRLQANVRTHWIRIY
jgi:hypothetical protein